MKETVQIQLENIYFRNPMNNRVKYISLIQQWQNILKVYALAGSRNQWKEGEQLKWCAFWSLMHQKWSNFLHFVIVHLFCGAKLGALSLYTFERCIKSVRFFKFALINNYVIFYSVNTCKIIVWFEWNLFWKTKYIFLCFRCKEVESPVLDQITVKTLLTILKLKFEHWWKTRHLSKELLIIWEKEASMYYNLKSQAPPKIHTMGPV